MSSFFGNLLKISLFGQSHGAAVGVTMDGIPAGLPVDLYLLQAFLDRRAPGRSGLSSGRKESDIPEFLSGVCGGYTCGAPLTAILRNRDVHSEDYADLEDTPRPGHADYTAHIKYRGYEDSSGGGHFSGRLTAPICIAGGLCIQWLAAEGITVRAHLYEAAGIRDTAFDPVKPQISGVNTDFPVISPECGEAMGEKIRLLREAGDSAGGIVECAVTGLPVGLGEPMFDSLESRIAHILFGIPAVKGVEFGDGFQSAAHPGSEMNDSYVSEGGNLRTATNHAGGILGGISNGMPLIFRAAFKPTPSIALPQQTIRYSDGKAVTIQIAGRHDPCVALRAVPVVEAAAAIAILDSWLEWKARRQEAAL